MRVVSLELENIRSYEKETISFPKGSVLLAGDVGSGKTTILLALEFALFGILKNEISAKNLLRHGSPDGKVTLEFTLDNVSYKVVRRLKKDAKGVKQKNGFLFVNDVKEELTPVELKSRILEILGYPLDLVTKNKSLLFRYTVYTPQEEMKRILFDDPNLRLETLRKVFGIDQYKLVADNASFLIKELRAESKALSLQLEELPLKYKELENHAVSLKNLQQNLEEQTKKVAKAKDAVSSQEKSLKSLEERGEQLRAYESKIAVIAQQQEAVRKREAEAREELADINKRLEKPLPEFDEQLLLDCVKEMKAKEKILEKIDAKIKQASEKRASLQTRRELAIQDSHKFKTLANKCLLCMQNITHEHKSQLLEDKEKEISLCKIKLVPIDTFLKEARAKHSLAFRKLHLLRTREKKLLEKKMLFERGQDDKKRLLHEKQERFKQFDNYKEIMTQLQERSDELKLKLENSADFKTKFEEKKRMLVSLRKEHEEQNVALVRLQEQEKHIISLQELLQKSIDKLETSQKRNLLIKKHLHWLNEYFLPALTKIERAVFSSLHHEFALLFSQWFDHIIQDEFLSVRLGEDFTPLAVQNGYDIDLLALSGGEKTAASLAYRLSLNQVINDFVGNLQTRDLLVLDEPTDGFSAHQLERLKSIFDQLRLSQLLIVSHEPLIEGTVDHIIRVRKQQHTSQVSAES